jgi:TetR/AcrR family transcriptional repressor of lmrAB and yxaGH operons
VTPGWDGIRPDGLTSVESVFCNLARNLFGHKEVRVTPPDKIPDEQLFQSLSRVFRSKGYDGASYSDLIKATGLGKASLYHRFPGGKEEMVDAVLSYVDRHFANYVLAPVSATGPLPTRTRLIARRLREFYDSGRSWCLLDTITLGENHPRALAHARGTMNFWIDAFTRLARESGLAAPIASRRAQQAVAAIEGALLVSRVLGNNGAFLEVLEGLPAQLSAAKNVATLRNKVLDKEKWSATLAQAKANLGERRSCAPKK